MIRLILSTHNRHKCEEIQAMLSDIAEISDLQSTGFNEEIPETGDTFEENARQKVQYIYDRTGKDCFADDSGLMVDALDGEPGVRSARYAGEPVDMNRNIDLLLQRMHGKKDRTARFVTVIAAIIEGKTYYFRGEVQGRLIERRCGTGGFGYDPIFIPDGYDKTFGELDAATKNAISHRANAIKSFRQFLTTYNASK
ncbi:MAG: RdgB/HAM1 family non-canonical purine NTP pyrophosphatase [Candidatus Aphodosoma sp.]